MFVKSFTFLLIVFAFAVSARAGVISATWMDQGCGALMVCGDVCDESTPFAPDSRQGDSKEALLCVMNDLNVAGMTTTTAGGAVGLGFVALPGTSGTVLSDPEFCWRLHSADDSLPPSPVLSGLLKPS